jgi:uncharacterized SAM-binding protein YcdF (DUF218 family)
METLLLKMYERLARNDAVRPVDLIFVLAGRLERKIYGLDLFHSGIAPRLILSIDRYEVSKTKRMDLPFADDLIRLRDRTLPQNRHFFVDMDRDALRIDQVNLFSRNTYGEILKLRDYVQDKQLQRVMVISTDLHLQRVALTVNKLFKGRPPEFVFCAVPGSRSSVNKEMWWIRRYDRGHVLREFVKLAGYRVLLSSPLI